jgi:hypothetical protein
MQVLAWLVYLLSWLNSRRIDSILHRITPMGTAAQRKMRTVLWSVPMEIAAQTVGSKEQSSSFICAEVRIEIM